MATTTLSIHEVLLDGFNPRHDSSEKAEEAQVALVENIRVNGLMNKPSVYTRGGEFYLLQGHRRLVALRVLAKKDPEKYTNMDFEIFEGLTDIQIAFMRLAENLIRKDLSGIEKGRELRRMQKKLGADMNDGDIAKMLDMTHTRFSQMLKIICLPAYTTEKEIEGKISASHAEELAKLLPKDIEMDTKDQLDPVIAEKIDELTTHIIAKDLSVAALKKIVDKLLEDGGKKKKSPRLTGKYLDAYNALAEQFKDNDIKVGGKDGSGYIRVDFSNEADLSGVLYKMTFIEELKANHSDLWDMIVKRIHPTQPHTEPEPEPEPDYPLPEPELEPDYPLPEPVATTPQKAAKKKPLEQQFKEVLKSKLACECQLDFQPNGDCVVTIEGKNCEIEKTDDCEGELILNMPNGDYTAWRRSIKFNAQSVAEFNIAMGF